MRRILLVCVAGLLAGLGLSACGSVSVASHKLASDHGWVLSCSKQRLSEPSFFILDCATSSPLVDNATWTSWSANSATGTGRLGVAPCNPVCKVASMDFYPHTQITLTDPTTVDGHSRVFTHVKIVYTFEGKRYSFERTLVS